MVKRASARRRPGKAKPGTKGLGPTECRLAQPTGAASEAAAAIEKAGGCLVGSYKEPLGGHPVLLSILPIDAVEPTPFQRDLSDAHHKRLADVINKTGRFLDPIIAVVAPKGGFWSPNGRHRLAAMRRLGRNPLLRLSSNQRACIRLISEDHLADAAFILLQACGWTRRDEFVAQITRRETVASSNPVQ